MTQEESVSAARAALIEAIKAHAPLFATMIEGDGSATYAVLPDGRMAALDYAEATCLEEVPLRDLGGILDAVTAPTHSVTDDIFNLDACINDADASDVARMEVLEIVLDHLHAQQERARPGRVTA